MQVRVGGHDGIPHPEDDPVRDGGLSTGKLFFFFFKLVLAHSTGNLIFGFFLAGTGNLIFVSNRN